MKFKNTDQRFGIIAILLHWSMAILMIGLVIIGLYMTYLKISLLKLQLYGWHKEYGLLVLMLVIVRLTWRLINRHPRLPTHLSRVQCFAAHAVHLAFYLLMFALPITGWLLTSAAGLPVAFFGSFVLPNLVNPNEHLRMLFVEVHKYLSYGLIIIFCAHVSAALLHHFYYKDDVLRRMLP